MRRVGRTAGRWEAVFVASFSFVGTAGAQSHAALIIRNNHEIPYAGAIEMPVSLPDGAYRNGNATARVDNGFARMFASLNAGSSLRLVRSGNSANNNSRIETFSGPFEVSSEAGRLRIQHQGNAIGSIEFGLVVVPGTTGSADNALTSFEPLGSSWTRAIDGTLRSSAKVSGYDVTLSASPYGGGSIDMKVKVARTSAALGPAYLALVRRVITASANDAQLRFNGRKMKGGDSPSTWDRDFWYTRGVDWISWRSKGLSFIAVNGFAPVPTIKRDTAWVEGSHFYVWEKTRQRADTTWLISEIAGPNADQAKSRYMPVTPYAAVREGDTVSLKWRLGMAQSPAGTWPESQLRAFAGYRTVSKAGNDVTVSLGVPSVSFGTSYFPYSTLAENFDYYRTPGLNSEAFWPTSPTMWKNWRVFEPRMRSDMLIIRSMGFENLRLHHLELLRTLPPADAFAFLDFIMDSARQLGLHVLVDSEGPADWITGVLSRYSDVVTRVELENEILIGGIMPGDPGRWTSLYRAAKTAAPTAQVFFTGAGNNAMFARLLDLGVPFDRVGLHAYKHGPQWIEAYSSHVLGSGGYASDIGKPMTIGEFNWKDLTRMSPESRRPLVAKIYETVLAPHAVPELFEFQFQESLTFNAAVAGSNSRHYEPLGLDRRPKPEGLDLMTTIRKYGSPTAPVRELPITVAETRFRDDRAGAAFVITNETKRILRLTITPLAYDGLRSRLTSARSVTLSPGASTRATVALDLTGEKRAGTYHHFIRADYDARSAYGWGVAANQGIPQFNSRSILGDRVLYPQGLDVVNSVDWKRPIVVAFGAKAAVLELESAYQLATTLQSATGRAVRVSSVDDLPDSISTSGLVVLVGTPSSNAMIPAMKLAGTPGSRPEAGVIWLNSANGHQSLVLGGPDAKAVEAAVVELELRFWPNAKDATMRITGMEPGAALGHRAGGDAVDPP